MKNGDRITCEIKGLNTTRPRPFQPQHVLLRQIVEQADLELLTLRQLGQPPASRVRRQRLRHQLRFKLDVRDPLILAEPRATKYYGS
jgi:hypothetical protein